MIRITKPAAPQKLLTDGKAETEYNKQLYENGVRDFEIKNSIYGHQTVKKALTLYSYTKIFIWNTIFVFNQRRVGRHFATHHFPSTFISQNNKDYNDNSNCLQ
jgi:hypothetical protein